MIVKYLLALLFLVGCGSGGSSTSPVSDTPAQLSNPNIEKTCLFKAVITSGNSSRFSASMFLDLDTPEEEQLYTQVIDVVFGSPYEFGGTGKLMNRFQLSRIDSGSGTLKVEIFRDGVLINTSYAGPKPPDGYSNMNIIDEEC